MDTITINIPMETIICSICLSSLDNNINTLSCSHSYHDNCINTWTHQNNTCPICRSNIKNKEIDLIIPNQNNQNNNRQYNIPFECCGLCCPIILTATLIACVLIFILI